MEVLFVKGTQVMTWAEI